MKRPNPARPIRVYANTSIFGGVHDAEFAKASAAFFSQVHEGRFQLMVSVAVEEELADAPPRVKKTWENALGEAEIAQITQEVLRLQKAYSGMGILGPKWDRDLLHVALATVSRCTMIVSWNFRHIVNFQKIPLHNAVNAMEGYPAISIYSPLEVTSHEESV